MTRACHGCRRRSRAATPSPATYVGRPETDQVLGMAMNILGNGLSDANREEETLSVREAELAMRRRLGNPERVIWVYAQSLYKDDDATLDDLREAVTTLAETERIMRRVLGGAHPDAGRIECALRNARAALRAHEKSPSGEI